MNKPGTAQVGAISKAQKDSKTKTTFSTTGDNKKLKIEEKKFRIFFRNFFEVSGKSHSAEKCKMGMLWDFLSIDSIAKYQKLIGGTIKKFRKKISLTVPNKGGKSHSAEKSGPLCFGMAFYLMLEALDALKMKY